MRLAPFIHHNLPAIVSEWESFARSLYPESAKMTRLQLRDHASGILEAVVKDLDAAQTRAAQSAKSKEPAVAPSGSPETALSNSTPPAGLAFIISLFAYVSSNLAHSFRNVGTTPGRLLIITVPAGLHEGFFADAGDIVEPGTTQFPPMMPPDLDRLQAAAARAPSVCGLLFAGCIRVNGSGRNYLDTDCISCRLSLP
jgi:hypothetical protein